MLYQLSYASLQGFSPRQKHKPLPEYFRMPGTIFKGTITASHVQANGPLRALELPPLPLHPLGAIMKPSPAASPAESFQPGDIAEDSMRRLRRTLPILLALLIIAVVVVVIVRLRRHAPPEAARLLPGADAFVYLNVQSMRWLNLEGRLPPVSREPEYEQFVQETGIQFERDLQEVAFAIHYPTGTALTRPGAPPPPTTRFSEVFIGRVNVQRLGQYLRKASRSVQTYNNLDIFEIPVEDRTVRVAILGPDTVAVSNHDDPQVIRGIVDRAGKRASPFGGPSLLRTNYKNVPFASLAWAIIKVDPSSESNSLGIPSGLSLIFPRPAVVVASARLLRAVHFKAEAFAADEADARRIYDQLDALLNIFHTAEAQAPKGGDPDVRAFFDSLHVEQSDSRAILTATVPLGFVHKALQQPETLMPMAPPAGASGSANRPAKPAQ